MRKCHAIDMMGNLLTSYKCQNNDIGVNIRGYFEIILTHGYLILILIIFCASISDSSPDNTCVSQAVFKKYIIVIDCKNISDAWKYTVK